MFEMLYNPQQVQDMSTVDTGDMTVQKTQKAEVTFEHSGAGFHNAVGMYVYDDAGNIVSTKMLFGDLSGAGVTGGPSSRDVKLTAGEHIGFFEASNADANGQVLKDMKHGGSFKLVDATTGGTENVNSGDGMDLEYVSKNGTVASTSGATARLARSSISRRATTWKLR